MDEAQLTANMQSTLELMAKQSGINILLGLLVLLAGIAATRVLVKLLQRLLEKAHAIHPAMHTMLCSGLKWVLYFLSAMAAASTMGIPITSFVALFSVVGIAVSLAVQGVLSNLAGGMIILGSKPFSPGDFIEADSVSGTVKDIGFLHTRLISPDGKMIFLPNSTLYTSRLMNYTVMGQRRIDLTIGASYGCAPEDVRAAVLDAVEQVEKSGAGQVLPDPAPQVVLENYDSSAIVYTVRVWTTASDYLTVRYALNEAIYAAFKRHQVEMTYPHINVHVN